MAEKAKTIYYGVFGATHEGKRYIRSYNTKDNGKDAKKIAEGFASKMKKPESFVSKWISRKVVKMDKATRLRYHDQKGKIFARNEAAKEEADGKEAIDNWRVKNVFK